MEYMLVAIVDGEAIVLEDVGKLFMREIAMSHMFYLDFRRIILC